MQDAIAPLDWLRMFLGSEPPSFLLEILVRTLIMYFFTLAMLRWIGGRSVAQLSVVEFLLVIALGSAVGNSLFYPEVPLIHAMAVIAAVVMIDKIIDVLIRRSRVVKQAVNGSPVQVMEDGRILKDGILDRQIGDLELMELLRIKGVANLGEVASAYLESNGQISVFRAKPTRPGLGIVPPWEISPPAECPEGEGGVCIGCGALLVAGSGPCGHCHDARRTAPSGGMA